MNDERKQQQRENNIRILDTIGNDEGNRSHIFNRAWKRIQAMKIVVSLLKRKRQDGQKALTNIELYADDWAFHHGTPIDPPDKPTGNFQEFVADCVDRAVTLHQRKQQAEENAEWRNMQGSLADFDDEPMRDLGGETEWTNVTARKIIDAQPELVKRYQELKK
jgi:hypothetical protein